MLQQVGHGVDSLMCEVCVFSLCVCVSYCKFSGFMPRLKNMHVRPVGNSKRSKDVNVRVKGSFCSKWPCDQMDARSEEPVTGNGDRTITKYLHFEVTLIRLSAELFISWADFR